MNATARNINEKKHEMSDAGKSVVDLVASEVKHLDPHEVKRTVSSARDTAATAFSSTTAFVRRNPVGTALGLCAFGFLAGMVTGHVRRSA